MANILHRPVILLDKLKNMEVKCCSDFSAIFLPILRRVDDCKDESGRLNLPIIIAWASDNHNRFVPLVRVKGKNCKKTCILIYHFTDINFKIFQGKPFPVLTKEFLPRAWLVDQCQILNYIAFEDNCCEVAGGRITEVKVEFILLF